MKRRLIGKYIIGLCVGICAYIASVSFFFRFPLPNGGYHWSTYAIGVTVGVIACIITMSVLNRKSNKGNGNMKCSNCGKAIPEGSQFCNFCGQKQAKPEINHTPVPDRVADKKEAVANQSFFTKHKKLVSIMAVILVALVVWKMVSPKTVESGNGYKHQIGEFNEKCDYFEICKNDTTTHRIHHMFDTDYYCDECWELFGQRTFNFLADIDGKNNSSDEARDAKVCAVKAVKDSLKSPSTADFCSYNDMTATSLGGDKWKVTGYVDAQNSFGATLRENWTVTLTLTGSGFKDYTVSFD